MLYKVGKYDRSYKKAIAVVLHELFFFVIYNNLKRICFSSLLGIQKNK